MKLYRICCQQEFEAIKQGGFEKLTFGGAMFRYAELNKNNACNSYPTFKKLVSSVKRVKVDNRLNAILKVFPSIPEEIPLFESELQKRKELCKIFNPKSTFQHKQKTSQFITPEVYDVLNEPNEKFDNVFLYTIKVAGFFDSMENIKQCFPKLSFNIKTFVMTIDFPENIALNFKGEGFYSAIGTFPEYALPMYMLEAKHILDYTSLDNDEIEAIKKNHIDKERKLILDFIKNQSQSKPVNSDADIPKLIESEKCLTN